MPRTKKHWTQTKAGKKKLKELAERRKTSPALEKAAREVDNMVSQAESRGYHNAMTTLDNRARDAQIELAKALAAIGHACAMFVVEWRR